MDYKDLINYKCWESTHWSALNEHVREVETKHLRDLLIEPERFNLMSVEYDGIIFDYTRQRVLPETMCYLYNLAGGSNLKEKIDAMFSGQKINITEDRAVLHTALRAPKDHVVNVDEVNVIPEVHKVLENIKDFSDKIRDGRLCGVTGKKLTTIISIGIGGSYLGPEFVYEALKSDLEAKESSKGRLIKFLANVDPVDIDRATRNVDPETTIVVVVSKTFTTAETMLNAKSIRNWLLTELKGKGNAEDIISKHMIAVSADVDKAKDFGILPENVFGFWDWVGGRYSVCSAVGILPLSIQYGYNIMRKFLDGAHSIDIHFKETQFDKNIPVIMGLLGIWNTNFMGFNTRAILPYSQALVRFPAHIQQVDMESNGKRVTIDGTPLPFRAGEVDFGEPGTNGQHSFYQLIHQGRTIPCDFIGYKKSQNPIYIDNELVDNHDELMSNFFAQPDALAFGKTNMDLDNEKIPPNLKPHKLFPGNKPSMSLLFNELNAYSIGQLLAIYEHRTAVQGFIWNINSFDQWGVELGKVLATKVRKQMGNTRNNGLEISGFNPCTEALLKKYLENQ